MSHAVLQEFYIAPEGLQEETLLLAPAELGSPMPESTIAWPLFFDYDIDGNRLATALDVLSKKYPLLCGRQVPHATLLYVLEIKPSTDKKKFGFPFVELKTELSLAEMILKHGRMTSPTAKFPTMPKLPFFLDVLDTEEALKGEAPVFKVRLVHCQDGCALTLCLTHSLTDAERYVEVYRDLSRAYRGVEIPDRTFDRSSQWPDQLVKHYPFLGEAVANLPRIAKVNPDLFAYLDFPNQSASMEAIILSKEVTEGMKKVVEPYLGEGEYVSTNDLIVALLWMIRCEVEMEDDTDNAALPIANTAAALSMEFRKNGVTIVPESFFGCASFLPLMTTAELDLEGKGYAEIFAKIALLVRKTVTDIRAQPALAAECIVALYVLASGQEIPIRRLMTVVSNLMNTCYEEADFGEGPPVMALLTTTLPLLGNVTMVCPTPGNTGGVMLHAHFCQKHLEKFKASKVMATCAPAMKLLYSDFSVEELQTMMKS